MTPAAARANSLVAYAAVGDSFRTERPAVDAAADGPKLATPPEKRGTETPR